MDKSTQRLIDKARKLVDNFMTTPLGDSMEMITQLADELEGQCNNYDSKLDEAERAYDNLQAEKEDLEEQLKEERNRD